MNIRVSCLYSCIFYGHVYICDWAILVTSGDYFKDWFKVNFLFIGIVKSLTNIYKKLSPQREIELWRFCLLLNGKSLTLKFSFNHQLIRVN